jgi:glycosyltransferase involved in cell wall biosynthesis
MPEERVRLGYLVSQYPAVTHTFILREIRAVRALGFDVRVVSIRPQDRPTAWLSPEEAEEAGLTFCVLGSRGRILGAHVRTLLSRPLAYLGALGYALRLGGWDPRSAASHVLYFAEAVAAGDYLNRAGIRHFHTHFASTVALFAARLFRLHFSLTVHGPDEFNDVAGFHMAEKTERATFVAAISRFAASQIMRASAPRCWAKIRVLPLGVNTREFAPALRQPGLNATAPPSPFRILSIGRLAPAKGFPVLVEAVARLLERGRAIELTIVGAGPQRLELEELIHQRNLAAAVRLAGPINHDRIIDFYSHTDAFLMASFAEGVPVVLMEAMAMEVPCVATWVAGVPELIRDGVDGLLAPPAGPEPLAAALETLMDNPALARSLGQSGRSRVLELYDLTRNSARLGETFRRCLKQ